MSHRVTEGWMGEPVETLADLLCEGSPLDIEHVFAYTSGREIRFNSTHCDARLRMSSPPAVRPGA
jgi:hypothetical protein